MISFKEYLIEYATKQNSQFLNITTLKAPNNGKSFGNVLTRKHSNTFKKEYKHKHPIVDGICTGKSNNVQLKGPRLMTILNLYGTTFEPGIKTLGNSDVEVEMFEDEEGMQVGTLRSKKQ